MSVTIKEIAKQLGVTPASVSMALKDHPRVSVARKNQIRKLADQLGYRPSMHAQIMQGGGRSKTLGVCVPMLGATVYSDLVQGIEDCTSRQGYNLILCTSRLDAARDSRNIELLIRRRVDGVIYHFMPDPHCRVGDDELLNLHKNDIPVVVTGGVLQPEIFSSILSCDAEGGRLLASHLIQGGRRRIFFLFPTATLADDEVARQRASGCAEACRKAKISFGKHQIIGAGHFVMDETSNYSPEKVAALLALPKNRRPDAIIASTDMLALRVMRTLKRLGARIPDDLAVVGFDDLLFAANVDPALTTVNMGDDTMGRLAAQFLLDRIASGNHSTPWPVTESVPCRLVVRESCGARQLGTEQREP
jgi:LacI family transcriptional regulator